MLALANVCHCLEAPYLDGQDVRHRFSSFLHYSSNFSHKSFCTALFAQVSIEHFHTGEDKVFGDSLRFSSGCLPAAHRYELGHSRAQVSKDGGWKS